MKKSDKEHYRLYKSGKKWIATMLMTTAVVSVGYISSNDNGQFDHTTASAADNDYLNNESTRSAFSVVSSVSSVIDSAHNTIFWDQSGMARAAGLLYFCKSTADQNIYIGKSAITEITSEASSRASYAFSHANQTYSSTDSAYDALDSLINTSSLDYHVIYSIYNEVSPRTNFQYILSSMNDDYNDIKSSLTAISLSPAYTGSAAISSASSSASSWSSSYEDSYSYTSSATSFYDDSDFYYNDKAIINSLVNAYASLAAKPSNNYFITTNSQLSSASNSSMATQSVSDNASSLNVSSQTNSVANVKKKNKKVKTNVPDIRVANKKINSARADLKKAKQALSKAKGAKTRKLATNKLKIAQNNYNRILKKYRF